MISTAALCAKAIKSALKLKFPRLKIGATSDIFAGGDSVDVTVVGDFTEAQKQEIQAFTRQYQEGSFDSMRDLYENTNLRKDLPQVKYVFVNFTLKSEDK